jgi:hypothetical protein
MILIKTDKGWSPAQLRSRQNDASSQVRRVALADSAGRLGRLLDFPCPMPAHDLARHDDDASGRRQRRPAHALLILSTCADPDVWRLPVRWRFR